MKNLDSNAVFAEKNEAAQCTEIQLSSRQDRSWFIKNWHLAYTVILVLYKWEIS